MNFCISKFSTTITKRNGVIHSNKHILINPLQKLHSNHTYVYICYWYINSAYMV